MDDKDQYVVIGDAVGVMVITVHALADDGYDPCITTDHTKGRYATEDAIHDCEVIVQSMIMEDQCGLHRA